MPLLPLSHQKLLGTGISRIPKKSSSPSASLANRQRRLTVDLGLAMFSSSPASSACLGPSRAHTPTSNNNNNPLQNPNMNGSFTLTLPRGDRPTPSPKCFGKSTHMLKEDYERERQRWEKKLEEAEQKLTEANVHNSELFQLKAELNRKIIDFEKSQRPLIEQNRRLNDRIKAANGDTRKLEEKLAHVQDELLTLKDAYDRVQKENGTLREQRAFPEKLEELSRYRAQVLEMSKCIMALRQSAAEKDRRHELLLLKIKRMRRAAVQESDRQSCAAGSEGSVEDSGSLGLDTLDEEVELSAAFAMLGLDGRAQPADFVLLRQQLEMANEAVADLQRELERVQAETAQRIGEELGRGRAELEAARRRERQLDQQLANVQAQNELLEFQLVEVTANRQKVVEGEEESTYQRMDKSCTTDTTIPVGDDDWEPPFDEEPRKRHNLSEELLNTTREGMERAEKSPMLPKGERVAIRHGREAIECLRNQVSFMETELNMAQCEMGRLERELAAREKEWSRQREEAQNERKQKKRELKAELEQLKKEKREEANAYAHQVEGLSKALGDKVHAISDLTDRLAHLGAEMDICRCQMAAAQADNALIKEQMGECLRERDRMEREVDRMRDELKEAGERMAKEAEERKSREQQMEAEMAKHKTEQDKDRVEMDRLRVYNRELEAQFNAQMEMIGALKRKLLTMKDREGPPKSAGPEWAAARSCGSTEDEQYHSEGSDESMAANGGAKGRKG